MFGDKKYLVGSVVGMLVFLVLCIVVLTQWEVDEEKPGEKKTRTALASIFGILSGVLLIAVVVQARSLAPSSYTLPTPSLPSYSSLPSMPASLSSRAKTSSFF